MNLTRNPVNFHVYSSLRLSRKHQIALNISSPSRAYVRNIRNKRYIAIFLRNVRTINRRFCVSIDLIESSYTSYIQSTRSSSQFAKQDENEVDSSMAPTRRYTHLSHTRWRKIERVRIASRCIDLMRNPERDGYVYGGCWNGAVQRAANDFSLRSSRAKCIICGLGCSPASLDVSVCAGETSFVRYKGTERVGSCLQALHLVCLFATCMYYTLQREFASAMPLFLLLGL